VSVHDVVPATHTPTQQTDPPSQAPAAHVCGLQSAVVSVPVLLHVWRPFPEQSVVPGTHEPPQLFVVVSQMWFGHRTGAPHCPVLSHVATLVLPLAHSVCCGAHTPWHVPATHVWLV
jgi:hypothetical protein